MSRKLVNFLRRFKKPFLCFLAYCPLELKAKRHVICYEPVMGIRELLIYRCHCGFVLRYEVGEWVSGGPK